MPMFSPSPQYEAELQVYLMLLEQLLSSSVASTIRIVRLLRVTRSARIMRFLSVFRNLCVSKPDIYAEDEAATALEARHVIKHLLLASVERARTDFFWGAGCCFVSSSNAFSVDRRQTPPQPAMAVSKWCRSTVPVKRLR
jgi:hypothetical protein